MWVVIDGRQSHQYSTKTGLMENQATRIIPKNVRFGTKENGMIHTVVPLRTGWHAWLTTSKFTQLLEIPFLEIVVFALIIYFYQLSLLTTEFYFAQNLAKYQYVQLKYSPLVIPGPFSSKPKISLILHVNFVKARFICEIKTQSMTYVTYRTGDDYKPQGSVWKNRLIDLTYFTAKRLILLSNSIIGLVSRRHPALPGWLLRNLCPESTSGDLFRSAWFLPFSQWSRSGQFWQCRGPQLPSKQWYLIDLFWILFLSEKAF